MPDEPITRGEIPVDLQGVVEQLRAEGTPEANATADVYQEVLDGKLPIEQARDRVIELQLLGA